MAQPEPGQLDQRMAQPAVAGFGDALLAVDAAALPGARGQPRIGGDLEAVGEAAEQRLEPEQRRELGADPAQPSERRNDARVRLAAARRLPEVMSCASSRPVSSP